MQMQSISHWGVFGDEHERDDVPRHVWDDVPIEVLICNLSVRSENILKREGIETVKQLRALDDSTMLQWDGFGRKSLREIREILADFDKRPVWYCWKDEWKSDEWKHTR